MKADALKKNSVPDEENEMLDIKVQHMETEDENGMEMDAYNNLDQEDSELQIQDTKQSCDDDEPDLPNLEDDEYVDQI